MSSVKRIFAIELLSDIQFEQHFKRKAIRTGGDISYSMLPSVSKLDRNNSSAISLVNYHYVTL